MLQLFFGGQILVQLVQGGLLRKSLQQGGQMLDSSCIGRQAFGQGAQMAGGLGVVVLQQGQVFVTLAPI